MQLQRDDNVMVDWFYDGGNRQMSRYFTNGSKSHFSYNASNWITSLQHSNDNGSFIQLDYAFDTEGNKQYESKIHRPDYSEVYTYDSNYRLTGFKRGNIATENFLSEILQSEPEIHGSRMGKIRCSFSAVPGNE